MLVLGIDVGDVRVGTALLETDIKIATPYKTVLRAKGAAERNIIELCNQRDIKLIISGLPLSADGTENCQCHSVKNFCRRLQKRIPIEIKYIDEHLSTEEAYERIRELHPGRFDRDKIDSVAAAIILERFQNDLDNKS